MELTQITWIFVAVIISLVIYYIISLRSRYQYWQDRGIAHLKPLPIFGNLLPVLCMRKSLGDLYNEAYYKYPDERIVGIYEMLNPVLVVRDPKLLEKIMVKDFQHFTDHTRFAEEEGLFAYGLFQLEGNAWRSIRYKISPAFTSGKLKGMFNGMLECTEEMLSRINDNLNKDYELRNAISVYAINVIANTVFGIQLSNKSALDEFVKKGSAIFNTSKGRFIQTIAINQFPKLASRIGLKFMPDDTTEYFKGFISSTLNQRINDSNQRNDYTQQLLKLKERGAIEIQSKEDADDYLNLDSAAPLDNIEISDDLLAGQAFQFLSAGFDPILVAMLFVLYDLSQNPEIQERCRDHIKEVLERHGEFTYACIQDMTFLEQCIQESLRMHPIAPTLFRLCTKNYYIPEEKLEIQKGQKVIISAIGLQMDPKHYPDPEVYNPDRFPPNITRQNFTYLPFGDGPRFCIGIRYAMIVMKLGLAKILDNYKLTLSEKTKVPFENNKQAILLLPKSKIFFNITKAT